MKTLRLPLLNALLALGAGLSGSALAQAQAPAPSATPAGGHLKLNTPVPEPTGARVQTDLLARPLVSQPVEAAPPQVVANPGLPRLTEDNLKAAPVAGSSAAPSGQAPETQTSAVQEPSTDAPAPLTKNFVPGQPVPTYATLQDAAAAGVDPLPELSLEGGGVSASGATGAPLPSWLSWVPPGVLNALRQLSKQPMLLLGALGGLAILLALRRVMAGRGQSAREQDDE